MSIVLLVVGLLLFSGLILIHEWGHFIMARRNGVEVEEFGLFFPPRLYKRRTKSGLLLTLNAIPFGGFVRLKGEHDSDTGKGTFGAASVWAKSKIMAAGVVMNLATALVLLTILGLIGMPQLIPNQFTLKNNVKNSDGNIVRTTVDQKLVTQEVLVGYVEPGSPAQKAGLQPEDQLNDISLPGYSPVSLDNAEKLPAITKSFAGKSVIIYYTRAGHESEGQTTLLSAKTVAASQKTNNPKGYLGISPTQFTLQRSTWSAPLVAVGLSAQVTVLTFQGLGHALAGLGSLIAGGVTGNSVARQHGQTSATSQIGGPVAIFEIMKSGSLLGYQFMLFLIGYISLILAIMNILPIPALDGGRLWITLVARAFKKPLSAGMEEGINLAGFLVLSTLLVLITIVDVKRYF